MIFLELLPSDSMERAKNGARTLLFIFAWIGRDFLTLIHFPGIRAQEDRRSGSVIMIDPYSRAISIFGYAFFVLLFIFAINYGQLEMAVASIGVLVMQLVGERLSQISGTVKVDRRVSRGELGQTLTYVIVDLGLFAALDIVAKNPASLPGLSVFGSITAANLGGLLAVNSLFTIQIAIAEEKFFRQGAANLGAKYGGPVLGILTSAVFFFAYHIPAENGDLLKLGIIAADGATLAWSDFRCHRLLPSLIAHLINNTMFLLVAAIIGPVALKVL